MAYKVFFGGQAHVGHTVTDRRTDALFVAFAMHQAGYAAGVQNLDTYEIIWQGSVGGCKLLPKDFDAGLLPIDRFPRNLHQRSGFPTGSRINIAPGVLRPEFEREGAIDRPRYMAAGSHGPREYTEVRID